MSDTFGWKPKGANTNKTVGIAGAKHKPVLACGERNYPASVARWNVQRTLLAHRKKTHCKFAVVISKKLTMEHKSYYHRHLPHWQPEGAIFFVTFNLAGSLPRPVIEQLTCKAAELQRVISSNRTDAEFLIAWKKMFKYMDDQLDASQGATCLANPTAASIVTDCLHKGVELQRFRLHRYCIMPNHVHALLEPLPIDICLPKTAFQPGWPAVFWSDELKRIFENSEDPKALKWHSLPAILKAMKGASARRINEVIGRTGALWNQESYDHWVRDEAEYYRIVSYIDNNPVKAGLSSFPGDYKWSSAG